jgi:hypothetical protein
MKYNYDETGNAFIYFLLIIHGFLLFAFSYYFRKSLAHAGQTHPNHATRIYLINL